MMRGETQNGAAMFSCAAARSNAHEGASREIFLTREIDFSVKIFFERKEK
jgi:hypothetical protein